MMHIKPLKILSYNYNNLLKVSVLLLKVEIFGQLKHKSYIFHSFYSDNSLSNKLLIYMNIPTFKV